MAARRRMAANRAARLDISMARERTPPYSNSGRRGVGREVRVELRAGAAPRRRLRGGCSPLSSVAPRSMSASYPAPEKQCAGLEGKQWRYPAF